MYKTDLSGIILNHTFYCIINTYISRMLLIKTKLMIVCTNVSFNNGQSHHSNIIKQAVTRAIGR